VRTHFVPLSITDNPLNHSTGGWALPSDLTDSTALVNLTLTRCGLVGPIPDFLGKLSNLNVLQLSYNNLTGMIPSSFAELNIEVLWLNNQGGSGLTGPIDVLTKMSFLTDVWLHGNTFTGPIPESIGALTALTRIWLNSNQLVGLIPSNLTSLPNLQDLQLDNNLLMGPIPQVKYNFTYSGNSFCASNPGESCAPDVNALLDFLHGLNYPTKLDSSWSGNDPCVGDWMGIVCSGGKVAAINLPNLRLNGTISPSLGNLDGLTNIKLGGNNLTGQIPSNLVNLKSLKLVNLSSNNLAPPVPSFPNGVTLLLANNPLIDKTASPSPSTDSSSSPGPNNSSPSNDNGARNANGGTSKKSNVSAIIVPTVAAGLIAISLAGFLLYYRGKRRKSSTLMPETSVVIHPRDSSDPGSNSLKIVVANGSNSTTPHSELNSSRNGNIHVIEVGNFMISVQVLCNATKNFSEKNILGRGGFGTVYKGELHDGTMIAVKRMEASVVTNKALDEFQAEIAMLTKVRHRNLVSILGFSMEGQERLLVYEYMPQGALSKHLFHWKHSGLNPLSWKRRLNIALDVARGMEYLHNLGQHSFIHRDLKSANILLGDDFRAKVSDFGLVKLAPDGKYSVATRLAGTFGYLAPEYAGEAFFAIVMCINDSFFILQIYKSF
jgi:Leucine-rich repeat (LRR) protein